MQILRELKESGNPSNEPLDYEQQRAFHLEREEARYKKLKEERKKEVNNGF